MLNKAFYSILFYFQIITVCIGVTTSPKKQHPLILAKLTLLKSANSPSPFFKQSLLYIGFLWIFPERGIFQWIPKISKFFILNSILSFKSN